MPRMRTAGRMPGTKWGTAVLIWLLSVPGGSLADDFLKFDFDLRLSNRFNLKQRFLNAEGSIGSSEIASQSGQYQSPLNLRFNKDEAGYSAFLGAGADLYLGQVTSLHLTLDSGELKLRPLVSYRPGPDCAQPSADPRCGVSSNGQPLAEQAQDTWFVRELFFEAGVGRDDWLKFRAGKMLVSTGGGFIMDNYALGGTVVADLDLGFEVPLKITLDSLIPNGDFTSEGKRSPYLYLDVAYLLSFFEELGVFFAWYHDGDNNVGEILRSTFSEVILNSEGIRQFARSLLYSAVWTAEVTTRGNLFWAGLRGNKIFTRGSLSATAILEFGSFDFSMRIDPIPEISFPGKEVRGSPSCLGGMLDVSFYYDVADELTLGSFLLFLSGETFKENQVRSGLMDYNSFISIYPYITRTNIFFSGGMNQSFSARSFSTSGVNGRGLIAPGLTAGLDIVEDLNLRVVSALLFSHGPHLTSGGRFYGWESNLNLQWNISKHLRALFEADYLWTGNFFDFEKPLEEPALAQYTAERNAWKILVGLDVFY